MFKVDGAGTLTTLQLQRSFSGGSDGGNPYAGLIQASDGSFYGTTVFGGASGRGTVFKMDSAGTLTTLHSFSLGSDGGGPHAGLIQASDGSFYGTTTQGGAAGAGTVFNVDSASTLTTLYSFSGGSDGGNPYVGSLIQASDGSFSARHPTAAHRKPVSYSELRRRLPRCSMLSFRGHPTQRPSRSTRRRCKMVPRARSPSLRCSATSEQSNWPCSRASPPR